LTDLSRFEKLVSDEPQQSLYTARLWSVSLKREIRVLVLLQAKARDKQKMAVLFSTDLELAGKEILRLYRARFQIEFLFRDAKQSAGLQSSQARDKAALSFHWNASFATVNLARVISQKKNTGSETDAFSMKSIKQRIFNEHLLELFISKLDLDPIVIKNHEQYEKLRNYAVIST
jgi:IS4 transposase